MIITKITVNTSEFKNAMERLFKVAPSVCLIEAVKNILLTTKGNNLYLSASNLIQYARIKLHADSTEDAGFVLSDTKALTKALKFFTGDVLTLEYEDGFAALSCGGKKVRQKTIEADAFPEFPELNNTPDNQFSCSNKKLKERFKAVGYAVSKDPRREVFQGICFRNSEMVASDSYRIAVNRDDSIFVDTPFVVPCEVLKFANDILGEWLQIITDNKHIWVIEEDDAEIMVISRLFNEKYPDFSKYIQHHG